VFILKTLQGLCFDTVLQVFILKVLRIQAVLQNGAILASIHSKGVAGKSGDANKKTPIRRLASREAATLLPIEDYTLAVPCLSRGKFRLKE
jgi:hypothetical protein